MPVFMPYLWLGIVLCAAIAEAIGKRMIALWMIPGGVVASVFAFLRLPVWAQILAFIAVSTVCCFLFFRLMTLRNGKRTGSGGTEDLIGKNGEVIEKIDNLAGCGLVSVGGGEWSARSVEFDGIIEEGTSVSVVAVEGVRLICRAI